MKMQHILPTLLLMMLALPHLAGADQKVVEKLSDLHEQAERELAEQQRVYAKIPSSDNKVRLSEAESEYSKRVRNLDLKRSEIVADFTERRPEDIRAMRERNLSWESIAREIGFHPSIIGIEIIDASPPPFAPEPRENP